MCSSSHPHSIEGVGPIVGPRRRLLMTISTKTIEAKNKAGRHSIGDGLYLCVSKGGRKSWVLRYQRNGKRHDAGLGPYPAVSLAAAREAAFEARSHLAAGLDPIHQRHLRQK